VPEAGEELVGLGVVAQDGVEVAGWVLGLLFVVSLLLLLLLLLIIVRYVLLVRRRLDVQSAVPGYV